MHFLQITGTLLEATHFFCFVPFEGGDWKSCNICKSVHGWIWFLWFLKTKMKRVWQAPCHQNEPTCVYMYMYVNSHMGGEVGTSGNCC